MKSKYSAYAHLEKMQNAKSLFIGSIVYIELNGSKQVI